MAMACSSDDIDTMPDSSEPDNKNEVMICPFYLHAVCPKTDEQCDFAHEMTGILPECVPCDFNARGMCKYGDGCWFSHGKPKKKRKFPKKISTEDTAASHKMRFSFTQASKLKQNAKPNRVIAEIVRRMRQAYIESGNERGLRNKLADDEKLPMNYCIHYDEGVCSLGNFCPCEHGNYCKLCFKYCLHPTDLEQRNSHLKQCEEALIKDMEKSFQFHNSVDKQCGICFDIVIDKEKPIRRQFGILEKCNHVFCLFCIKEWRRTNRQQSTEQETILDQRNLKACPTCRITSDVITPSHHWYGCDEEKEELITGYKAKLKTRHCKFFKRGAGECPFGGNCLYLHETADGAVVELSPPSHHRRSRHNRVVENEDDYVEDLIVWQQLENNNEARDLLQERLENYFGNEVSGEHFLV